MAALRWQLPSHGDHSQVALQESFLLSGIPEYLRILAKPTVDVILNGRWGGSHEGGDHLRVVAVS